MLRFLTKPTLTYYSFSLNNLYYFSLKLLIIPRVRFQCHSIHPLQKQIQNKKTPIFKPNKRIKNKDLDNLGSLGSRKIKNMDPILLIGNHKENPMKMAFIHLFLIKLEHQEWSLMNKSIKMMQSFHLIIINSISHQSGTMKIQGFKAADQLD